MPALGLLTPTGPLGLLTRTVLAAALAATVAAAAPTAAPAATYDVTTCTSDAQRSPRPSLAGADDAWTQETNDAVHYEFLAHCAPTAGVEFDGLVLQSRLNSGETPLGTFGQLRFEAPAGNAITRLRLWREIGKFENDWRLYTRTAEGVDLDGGDCPVAPTEFRCQVGAPGAGPADWIALSTSGLRIGFSCSNAMTSCATGATLNEAWTAIYSAIVTIDDPTAPTATGPTGSLLDDGFLHGTATGTLASAADSSGIKALQIRADADHHVVAQTQRACDYTRRAPCTNLTTPASVSLDTKNLGDGQHSIELGVTDAAGNFTAAATKQVTVDNTAPVAPTAMSPTELRVNSPSATITWANPSGQVAPIVAAHVTLCDPTNACRTTVQPASGNGGSATVTLGDSRGFYYVAVALEDAAGNVDAAHSANWIVIFPPSTSAPSPTPTPPPPPTTAPTTSHITSPPPALQPTPTLTPAPRAPAPPRLALAAPAVARDRQTLTVHGSVAPGVTGRVTATARARIHGRMRTVVRRVAIRGGRYRVRLRLPSSAWRTATVTVRFAGGPDHQAARATRRATQRTR